MRTLLIAIALMMTTPASAQQVASMSADDAYVRAVAFMQREFVKLRADQDVKDAQLTSALAEIKRLRDQAKALNTRASAVLADISQGQVGKGVDVLMSDAAAKAQASAAQAKAAAEDYKHAGSLAYASDTNRAISAYEQALKLAPDDVDATQQLLSLYIRAARTADAAPLAARLAASADPDTRIGGLLHQGHLEDIRSNFAAAEAVTKQALDSAVKARLKKRQVQALSNLGSIAQSRGEYQTSFDYTKRALAIADEIGDKDSQAMCLSNLGSASLGLENVSAAEDYFKKALALHTALGNKEDEAIDLSYLGTVAYDRWDFNAAKTYGERALALNIEIGATLNQAGNLVDLANVAAMRNDLNAAEDYDRRALAAFIAVGDKQGQGIVLNNLGNTVREKGDTVKGCDFYRQSLAMKESIGIGASPGAKLTRDNIAKYCKS